MSVDSTYIFEVVAKAFQGSMAATMATLVRMPATLQHEEQFADNWETENQGTNSLRIELPQPWHSY